MSCRRKDTAALIGCRVGDVALRGCCRGCCPYTDDEISENTREHLLRLYYPPTHYTTVTRASNAQPPGRRGLYYNQCQSQHRPKFICAKPSCRRMIKPFYDPDNNEYRIDEYQGWGVRPLPQRHAEFSETVRRAKSLGGNWTPSARKGDRAEKQRQIWALRDRWSAEKWPNPWAEGEKSEPLTEEELDELRRWDPETWWIPITEAKRQDRKRCPSCGDSVVRVGSNFRVPKKGDNKAWRKITEMIEAGEDLEAKFSMCWTIEQHAKMVEKAIEIRAENRPS
ncbi:hypothetical protein F5884DRAFT_796118 [Xylogone sp. PMI_703]|nr:hypothetical protein F5884DRAFT_796118 [Xylogone sp. PMI_703]